MKLETSYLTFKERFGSKFEIMAIFFNKYPVSKMYVFGSALRNDFTDSSDIDFEVEFKPFSTNDYFDVYYEIKIGLEEIFHRKVDLIDANELKNQRLKNNIEGTRIEIYAA